MNLEGVVIKYTFRFSFKATNNQAEYKALLARLKLAKGARGEKPSGFHRLLSHSRLSN